MATDLHWLAPTQDWKDALRGVQSSGSPANWATLVKLANQRLDFLQTNQLDRVLRRCLSEGISGTPPPVRLAILASSTMQHLTAAIRVAALRRGLLCEVYEPEYGQYLQELSDEQSGLSRFQPMAILFAFDSHHAAEADVRKTSASVAQDSMALVEHCWRLAKERFRCSVLQQTLLPVFDSLMGSNEARLPFSPVRAVSDINRRLRESADEHGVHLVALDHRAGVDGINAWYNAALWHRAKQEIDPRIAPLYGELVVRVLAADLGLSSKCLVLDLDNTLWGGVIGDDGVAGICLGQGSGLGEAYVNFQRYLVRLSQRGIILAVCSKNDELNALLPFERHPEMLLRRSDIGCFVANWQDKASNLRSIARMLNIGVDSLVFADDNLFEREQVRAELPEVAVPELPEDPAYYASTLADAGYFEAVSFTVEDSDRGSQYQANAERNKIRERASDLTSYLAGLQMKMIAGPFEPLNLKRVTQLINKTNQFNLTTRRYTESEVESMTNGPEYFTRQLRLLDRLGDNGIISVLIGKVEAHRLVIDTWLMSCRVLGRQVEEAALDLLVEAAREKGLSVLAGEYRPSEKNAMVRDFYFRLGFTPIAQRTDGVTNWELDLQTYAARDHKIEITSEAYATS